MGIPEDEVWPQNTLQLSQRNVELCNSISICHWVVTNLMCHSQAMQEHNGVHTEHIIAAYMSPENHVSENNIN